MQKKQYFHEIKTQKHCFIEKLSVYSKKKLLRICISSLFAINILTSSLNLAKYYI